MSVVTLFCQTDRGYAGSYTSRTEFDSNYGRVKAIEHASGIKVAYEYDPYGNVLKVKNAGSGFVYQENVLSDALQNITYAEKNNGTLFESRTYDQVSGQLKQVSAASAVGNELHYLAYYYGRFGNLDSQTMKSNNGAMSVTESYSYDDLHRLMGSSLSSGGSISYSYDATGNLTQKSDYASSMTYGSSGKSNTGNAGPNAVLSATLVGGGSTSFSYDNNGNLISGAGKTISYNALNKPTQITAGGSTVNFAYDANWQRFKKTVSGNRTVYYIDDSVEVEQVDDTTITRTYIDDVAIVKRTKYAGLSLASHEITYTLRDRLGSVVTLTDHNNNILEHRSYDPFGKPRYGTMLPSSAATLFDVAGGTPFTLHGFTDHEHIDEAQLIHMNGRVYDYNLGRFLSIDPLIQAPGNSQSLNPYSYIMNNPLAGTDPSGYALVQGSIDCDESMAACVTVLNGGTPTKNDFSGAAASNGSAPSSDGSDSDVEAEELGAPGEVGASENQTPDLRVTQQEQDWADEGNLASLYKSRALKGEGNVANVGLGVWGSFEDNVEVHGFLGALYWKSFVGTLTKLNSYASLSDGAAYLPFLDGADAKVMMAHIHNKPMAIRIAQEHLKAVRNDFKYDTKGVPGRLSEAQITTYHHAVFKEFNANTRFYGGTLFTGESNGNFAKAWKWSLSWAYCGLSCDSN